MTWTIWISKKVGSFTRFWRLNDSEKDFNAVSFRIALGSPRTIPNNRVTWSKVINVFG